MQKTGPIVRGAVQSLNVTLRFACLFNTEGAEGTEILLSRRFLTHSSAGLRFLGPALQVRQR